MFQDMNAVVLYSTDTGDGGYCIQDNSNCYVLKTDSVGNSSDSGDN